ncbi:class I SAM-dependent methyltransferase [Novosphingobium sp. 9]|uniref:class I SAM-dependent methyltransferase n=1 Tax=Novosphingobium sp. 9 TaxID=2025349 RepID=UPI0021B6BAE6|nr:SAM-dependent methyltransferase [Novosphingobium sp. 9]
MSEPGGIGNGGDGAPEGESLSVIFRRLIANYGPITIQHYFGESNARYYTAKDPLGSEGDFVTAPEISQMFGELIGLWLADMWIRAGKPEPVHYVELGPGRGTLARDALRVMARYGLTPQVHFVEGSAALKAVQLEAVPHARWHGDLDSIPHHGALLVVGNEFLDALPIRQFARMAEGWRERMVGLADNGAEDGQGFLPIAGEKPMDLAVPVELREAPEGTIVETCPPATGIVYELAGRLNAQGGCALLIDYGHAHTRTGSTLQAVRAHRKVDPFVNPGEADLTAHVDFEALSRAVLSREGKWLGTVTQGHFLRALGIEARTAALAAKAPAHIVSLETARDRLIEEGQMGALFKVMGIAAPQWPDGAGF